MCRIWKKIKTGIFSRFILFITVFGACFTLNNITYSLIRFQRRTSTISQTELRPGAEDAVFPTIILCSDSMHSKKRVEQLKGGDKINVMSLYGDYGTFSSEEQELSQLILQKAAYNISIPDKMILDVKKKWENFSDLTMSKFFYETRPQYFLIECKLQNIDCLDYWTPKWTLMGYCIELNLKKIKAQKERQSKLAVLSTMLMGGKKMKQTSEQPGNLIKQLELTIGYNRSDSTFGWNGFNNALNMYYLHPEEEIINESHSVPLVTGLTPVVDIVQIETKLLGDPFTKCIKAKNYTIDKCSYKNFLQQVIDVCGCYPTYAKDGYNLFDITKLKECDFSDHAICISTIKMDQESKVNECKPSCHHKTVAQDNIHYNKLDEKKIEFVQNNKMGIDDPVKNGHMEQIEVTDIKLISVKIRMAEVAGTIYTEREDYSLIGLLSDIGGALSLFLGLSLIDLIRGQQVLVRRFLRYIKANSQVLDYLSRCKSSSESKEKEKPPLTPFRRCPPPAYTL